MLLQCCDLNTSPTTGLKFYKLSFSRLKDFLSPTLQQQMRIAVS